MKVRKIAIAIAASIALSSPAFAETDEERMVANCDWPETGTAAKATPVPEADKTSTAPVGKETARSVARSVEEILASCDYPEEV